MNKFFLEKLLTRPRPGSIRAGLASRSASCSTAAAQPRAGVRGRARGRGGHPPDPGLDLPCLGLYEQADPTSRRPSGSTAGSTAPAVATLRDVNLLTALLDDAGQYAEAEPL